MTDMPITTLADQVGHGTFALMPIFKLIERHVLSAERLHGDDTTIRILAKGKCTTGRIWIYVRDDQLRGDNYGGRFSGDYDGRWGRPSGPVVGRGGAPTGERV